MMDSLKCAHRPNDIKKIIAEGLSAEVDKYYDIPYVLSIRGGLPRRISGVNSYPQGKLMSKSQLA